MFNFYKPLLQGAMFKVCVNWIKICVNSVWPDYANYRHLGYFQGPRQYLGRTKVAQNLGYFLDEILFYGFPQF